MNPSFLQVLPSFDAGGVERVTFETVMGLTSRKFGEHHIASSGGQYTKQLPPQATHHTLPLASKNPFTLIANSNQLYKLIKKENIQTLHARSRAPAWSSLWACRRANIPFITTYHGTYSGTSSLKTYYNSIMARGDKVVAISRSILNHIAHTHPELASKVVFIPEGIDTHYFDPTLITPDRLEKTRSMFDVPEDATVLLLPGRLTRWKGQAWFLQTLQKMQNLLTSKKTHIILLGDAQGRDHYLNELTQLAGKLPVHFITSYDDLPAAYALANIVFSCSLDPEAFGRVTAEALSMGRPFIGTNHGGTVELTHNGKFGTLVGPNDETALITAITYAFNQTPAALLERGNHARAHICSHYSLDQMLDLTQQLYESIL